MIRRGTMQHRIILDNLPSEVDMAGCRKTNDPGPWMIVILNRPASRVDGTTEPGPLSRIVSPIRDDELSGCYIYTVARLYTLRRCDNTGKSFKFFLSRGVTSANRPGDTPYSILPHRSLLCSAYGKIARYDFSGIAVRDVAGTLDATLAARKVFPCSLSSLILPTIGSRDLRCQSPALQPHLCRSAYQ